jgi:hypothetical protein
MEFSGRGNGWTQVNDWRTAEGLQWERGLPGSGVADCIADSGTLSFILNNSSTNSAHLVGYYSPDHANCRAGFQLLIGVRARVTVGATSYPRFTGYLDYIAPEPGIHRAQGVRCECIGWMGIAGRTRLNDLPILLDATGDDVFQTIIDGLPDFSQPRAVEKDLSADVYPYVLDRIRDEQTRARDELYRLALSGLDRVWERGDGTVVYEARTRRTKLTTNTDTFTNTHGFTAPHSAENIANSTQTTVHPRLPSPNTTAVLFSLNQPLELAIGQSVDILGPWTDADNPDVRVGAVSLVSLVAGTDYVANAAEDGSGVDLTANLTVTVGLSGNATQFSVTLSGVTAGWLTVLQQRGQALLDYGPIPATQIDQDSIDRFGLNPLNIDLPYQSNANFGIELAQYIIFTRSEPTTQVEGFRRMVGVTNTAELTRSLGREISDRIGIVDVVTGISKSFFIDHIRETIYRTHIETEFTLSVPIDSRQFWELEVVGRSELDISTRLGFGLIIGHTDVAHGDVAHTDTHSDVSHSDSHTDNAHQDQAHGDGAVHGDSVHQDTAHSDVSHSDVTHGDAHSDDVFQDAPHGDSHSDSAHIDDHSDTHTDVHTDHIDAHLDVPLVQDHGDGHADLHSDTHTDQLHGDGHSDSAHIDEAHEDGHTDTPHNDVSHADVAHVDIAHNDGTSHSDVAHADSAHGDVAHSDVSHTDTHGDVTHSDTAHGDAN